MVLQDRWSHDIGVSRRVSLYRDVISLFVCLASGQAITVQRIVSVDHVMIWVCRKPHEI